MMQRAECCADAELNHLIKSSIKAPMNYCSYLSWYTLIYIRILTSSSAEQQKHACSKAQIPPTNPTTPWKTALFASYPLTMLRPAGLLCEPNPLASDPSSWEAHWVPLSWLRESEPELSSAQRGGRLINTSTPALWAVFSEVYLQPASRLSSQEDLEQWWKNDLDHRQQAVRLCEDMTWASLAAAAHP